MATSKELCEASDLHAVEAAWNWDKEHQTRMRSLLETGFLSDIVLIVGAEEKEIKAHHLFLQAGSPELYRQFKGGEKKLKIPNVDYDSFMLFLKFLYTGETGSELENLSFLPLLKIATDYKVGNLANICANKAKRSLSDGNAIQIFQQAMECGHTGLIEHSLIYICRNAWRIVELESFTELKNNCLFAILERDDLQVQSELQLFNAVMRWAEAECVRSGREPGDWENIRLVLSKVIGLIRFPVMDQTEFTLNVALKNILVLEELVKILLYFTVPSDKRAEIPPGRFIAAPRLYYKEPQGLKSSYVQAVPKPKTRIGLQDHHETIASESDEYNNIQLQYSPDITELEEFQKEAYQTAMNNHEKSLVEIGDESISLSSPTFLDSVEKSDGLESNRKVVKKKDPKKKYLFQLN